MTVFQNEGCGERRIAVIGDQGLERIFIHRDLVLNFGDRVMAKITAFHPTLHGYFADTDRGSLFIPTTKPFTEGESVLVQIVKEARSDKVPTAHLADECEKVAFPTAPDVSSEQMDEWIADALRSNVKLPGCGVLHIERTKVCWTIDIDSGSGTDRLENLNHMAIPEIARQIALKNMGGLILIDFAGSKRGSFKKKVEAILKEALKSDALCSGTGWTRSGLFEVERKRERSDLLTLCSDDNPVCIYYRVRRALGQSRYAHPIVRVAPAVLGLLKDAGISAKIEAVFDRPMSYFEILEK